MSERARPEDARSAEAAAPPPRSGEVRGSGSANAPRPPIVERLLARRDRHKKRTMAFRVAWSLSAFLIIVAGILITPLPGPGPLIVVPAGLAMLALEFVWAERLLERALVYGDRAKQGASSLSPGVKIALATVGVLAFAGAILAVYLWDIPLLPDS